MTGSFYQEFLEALGIPEKAGNGGSAPVAAFVGAGGKTGALFAAARGAFPLRVIVTTTTHIRDPRAEEGRWFEGVAEDSRLGGPADPAPPDGVPDMAPREGRPALVVYSRGIEGSKLAGIHPSWLPFLRSFCDLVLVEADGSRGLPIKAPSEREPPIPDCADVVAGVIGLDCVGRPMDGNTVHRPERFEAVTGCLAGQAIGPRHLAALAESPEGLFKSCPPGARRVLILNKADAVPETTVRSVLEALGTGRGAAAAEGFASVLVCSFKEEYIRICELSGALQGRVRSEGRRP